MGSYAILNGRYTSDSLYGIEFTKAEGSYLYDENNRRYLDLRSGLWNVTLGADKSINLLLKESFNKILDNGLGYLDIHSYNHKIYNEVSDKIIKIVGDSFQNVLFTNSGSENTDLALKISGYINKKGESNKILAFKNSYHGTFFGGVSVSGLDQSINNIFFPKYGDVKFIDFPSKKEEEQRILKWIEEYCGTYDAMFIEPVLASAGVYKSSINFFNKLLKILKKNNVLIVFDEVATGFFKTGKTFYFNYLTESPDIVCLSKSINNGVLPFGCVIVSSEIDERLSKSLYAMEHFSTQNGNLLGMESANVILDYYLKNKKKLLDNVEKLSSCIEKCCVQEKIDFRQIGIMTSIKTERAQALFIVNELKKLGILVYLYLNDNEEGISIIPQINIDEPVLEKAIRIIIKKVKFYQ